MRLSVQLLIIFALSVLTFRHSSLSAEPIRFFEGSFEALQKEAVKTRKYIFIDFYTDWCRPCLMMQQSTFQDDSLGNFMNTFYLSYKVNCEKDTVLKNKFKVPTYPYWVFMTPEGKIQYQYTGYADAFFFLNRAKETINYNPHQYRYTLNPQNPTFFEAYLREFSRVFPDSAQKETEIFLNRFTPSEWVKMPLWEITKAYIRTPESPTFQMIMLKAKELLPIQPEIKSFAMTIMSEAHVRAFKTLNHEEIDEYKKSYTSVLNSLGMLKYPVQAYEDELEAEFAMRMKNESLFLAITQSLLSEYFSNSADKYADYSVMAIQTFSGENAFQLAFEWAKKAESLEPLAMKPQYALAYYKYRLKEYATALRYIEKAGIYALDIAQRNSVDELERKIKSKIK